MNVSSVLSEQKKKQVIALGQLGWTLRRIQEETGVRRETAAAHLKAAGITVRSPGRCELHLTALISEEPKHRRLASHLRVPPSYLARR